MKNLELLLKNKKTQGLWHGKLEGLWKFMKRKPRGLVFFWKPRGPSKKIFDKFGTQAKNQKVEVYEFETRRPMIIYKIKFWKTRGLLYLGPICKIFKLTKIPVPPFQPTSFLHGTPYSDGTCWLSRNLCTLKNRNIIFFQKNQKFLWIMSTICLPNLGPLFK